MTDGERPWVYFFGDNAETVDGPDKELLGGKGASLAAMSRAGLPVPPGFTISTTCCRRFHKNGRWPDGLEDQVRQHLSRLEEVMGRRFGRGSSPLLVSVRSGAAVSMPGMMDTILNCGLHPALASEVGDTASFWRVYLQFIVAFAGTVANLAPETLCPNDSSSSATPSRETAEAYLRVYGQRTGRPFPTEPWELLKAKHFLMMGYELLRLAILELSRRWDLGRDVFFLQLDELESFEEDRAQLEDVIAGRKLRWQSLQRLDMPRVIDSENLDGLGLPQEYDGADRLDGDAIAAGTATGTARPVFDPRQTRDLGRDYILVCPSTDPSWAVLFVEARGLVVERGGMLSHGAIVARDFGIPAVVFAGATRRIRDGDRLQVDGNRGEIHILRGGAHADDT